MFSALSGHILQLATTPVRLAIYLVMGVSELQQHVKIVKLITSLQDLDQLALFAVLELILPRETLPVLLVILRVPPATKLQPLV